MTETAKTSPDKPDPTAKILIDYRGTVGHAPGQPEIAHVRSPLILMQYEHGVPTLTIFPGLNLVAPDAWAQHKSNGQVKAFIDAKRLHVVKRLPTDGFELLEMIKRTIDTSALEWLLEQEKGKPSPSDGIIAEIENRLANTTTIESTPTVYTQQVAAA